MEQCFYKQIPILFARKDLTHIHIPAKVFTLSHWSTVTRKETQLQQKA